jgi:hypothetical protein
MIDHAAAVEAIRKRIQEQGEWTMFRPMSGRDEYDNPRLNAVEQAHADRATLLRAYEAVVEERDNAQADARECHAMHCAESATVTTLRAQHAALVEGLQSIAANTCCDRCQEAALVATQLLATLGGAEGV